MRRVIKSPWLRKVDYFYADNNSVYWVCHDTLHEFFDIPDGSDIQIAAYAQRCDDSYLVRKMEFCTIEVSYFGKNSPPYFYIALQPLMNFLPESSYVSVFYRPARKKI